MIQTRHAQEIANNNEETEEELHQPSNLPPQQQEQTLLEELASTAALYNPEEHDQGTENEIFNQEQEAQEPSEAQATQAPPQAAADYSILTEGRLWKDVICTDLSKVPQELDLDYYLQGTHKYIVLTIQAVAETLNPSRVDIQHVQEPPAWVDFETDECRICSKPTKF